MAGAFFQIVFLAVVIGTTSGQSNDQCEPPTADELKVVIGNILITGGNAGQPTVNLMNYTIVCRAIREGEGMLYQVSVIVEYNCTGNANCSTGTVTEQIETQCSGGAWTNRVLGDTVHVRSTSPEANLTTPGRDDCAFCVSQGTANSAGGSTYSPDTLTHCVACDPSCMGLGKCTGIRDTDCCNFYNDSTCVEVCPKFSTNSFTCVDTCPTFFTNNSDNECVCQDGREGIDCTELVHCDNLTDPENGRVEVNDTVFDTEAYYTCNTGYALIGVTSRRCLGTGNWSDSEPRCEIDCGELSDPDNGTVMFSTTILGSTANYSCNDGYAPTGNLTRTCESNGEWSGKEPTCTETDDDDDDDDDDDNDGFPVGAIVGIVVAVLVAIGCVIAIVVLLLVMWKKKKKNMDSEKNGSHTRRNVVRPDEMEMKKDEADGGEQELGKK